MLPLSLDERVHFSGGFRPGRFKLKYFQNVLDKDWYHHKVDMVARFPPIYIRGNLVGMSRFIGKREVRAFCVTFLMGWGIIVY